MTSTPRAPPCGARAAPNEPPSSLPLSLFSSFHFFDHAHLRWFPNRECECALRFGTARNGGHHACEPRFGCFWRRISCFRMSRGTLIIFIGRWMSDISAQPMKIRVHLQSKGGKITSENPLSISSRHPAFHVAPNRASCTEFCAAVTSPMQGKAESDVSGSEFTAESPAVSLRFRTTARGRIAIAGMCRNCIMRNSHDRVSFLKWDMGVIWAICMHGQSE